jgi:hypothetical protein
VRLGIALAQGRRDAAIGVVRVHRGADREAGDEPATRQHVEHREFLGDADRRLVERDRAAEHDEGGA